jgi:menaquinone-dependent protoporphyrinogen IX oxidase
VLTPDTKIVGVQSGKIPKFLLKNDWKPMSVISIGNTLRHNKTAVYANCCDLVISYTDKEPLYEPKIAWE